MKYDGLNEAIYGTLAMSWGFVDSRFVPRRLVAHTRRLVLEHYPMAKDLTECHSELINRVIEKEEMTRGEFDTVEPIYSGQIEASGMLRIFKSANLQEMNGVVRIPKSSLDEVMQTLIHFDWRQELREDTFTFPRTALAYLPVTVAYLD